MHSAQDILNAALLLSSLQNPLVPWPSPKPGETYFEWQPRLAEWCQQVGGGVCAGLPFLGNSTLAYDAALVLESAASRVGLTVEQWQQLGLPPIGDAPTTELWFKTTAGFSVSCGIVMRSDHKAVVAYVNHLKTQTPLDTPGAVTTYHLVKVGSYEGYPEPSLGQLNQIEPSPT